LLSQPASRLCIAAFLFGILRLLRESPGVRRQLHAALAGFALGYGFNTRPLVALVFGTIGAVFVLYRIGARPDRNSFIRPAIYLLAPGLLMVGLCCAWNGHLTGNPWLSTYHALQSSDRMGFGLRGEGYAPLISDFRTDFTPAYAFARIWLQTIPCVLFNSLGWGAYEPSMFFPSDPQHHFPLLAFGLIVPLSLLVIPFADRSRCAADLFCGLILVLTVAALFFQYSDHGTWGSTPVHCSYYSEATLFGIIPLTARGILILYDAARRRVGGASPLLFAAGGLLLLANTIHSDAVSVGWFKNWDPYYQALPRLVAAANIHDAVVFIPASRNAPLGEYPFKPLNQADVVYFRTGPLPAWGLNTGNWRIAYDKYFSGRSAYVYDKVALKKLDTTTGDRPAR